MSVTRPVVKFGQVFHGWALVSRCGGRHLVGLFASRRDAVQNADPDETPARVKCTVVGIYSRGARRRAD